MTSCLLKGCLELYVFLYPALFGSTTSIKNLLSKCLHGVGNSGADWKQPCMKHLVDSSSYRVHTLDTVFLPKLNTLLSNIIVACKVLWIACLLQQRASQEVLHSLGFSIYC